MQTKTFKAYSYVVVNAELLTHYVARMEAVGCLKTPSIEALSVETLRFHQLAHNPHNAEQVELVAHTDAWSLRRMLTFLRRKWQRQERPRATW